MPTARFSAAGLKWFSPAFGDGSEIVGGSITGGNVNPPEVSGTLSRQDCPEEDSGSSRDISEMQRRPKHVIWRPPRDISVMPTDSKNLCCQNLKCVRSISADAEAVQILRQEQKDLANLTSWRARSDWVRMKVPVTRPKKYKGSMEAGGTLVCNSFFCRAFGVSKNSIESAKKNPGSAVMKKRWARFSPICCIT